MRRKALSYFISFLMIFSFCLSAAAAFADEDSDLSETDIEYDLLDDLMEDAEDQADGKSDAEEKTERMNLTVKVVGTGSVTFVESGISPYLTEEEKNALLDKTVTDKITFSYPVNAPITFDAATSLGAIRTYAEDADGDEIDGSSYYVEGNKMSSAKMPAFEEDSVIVVEFGSAKELSGKGVDLNAEDPLGDDKEEAASVKNTGTVKLPNVGDVFWGKAVCTYVKWRDAAHIHPYYSKVKPVSGFLKNKKVGSITVRCVQPGIWAITPGNTLKYKAKVTSVNKETGQISGKVYLYISGKQNQVGYFKTGASKGKAQVQKLSKNTSMTEGNPCYSLAGAKYGVFKSEQDAKAGNSSVATLTTDSSGKSDAVSLSPGTYFVKELSPSKGYGLDSTAANPVKVTVKPGKTVTFTTKEPPQSDPVDLLLQKGDKESMQAHPLGGARLEGAEYTINYYKTDKTSASGLEPAASWVYRTDENGMIRFQSLEKYFVSGGIKGSDKTHYYDSKNYPSIPLGLVTIQETKAPTGYLLNDEVFTRQITTSGKAENVNTYNTPTFETEKSLREQVFRCDFKFVKTDNKGKRLSEVQFKLKSNTTGEEHIIQTDPNGEYSSENSWAAHDNDTNGGKYTSGTWFGIDSDGKQVPVNNNLGALPFESDGGSYTLEEIRGENNKDVNLIKTTFKVYRNATTVDLGTLVDTNINIYTTAWGEDTKNHIAFAGDGCIIKDTVRTENLEKGKSYTLKGSLINAETGEPVLSGGEPVTAEKSFKCRVESETEQELTFTFDAKALAGTKIVIFEELYEEGKDEPVASHKDINDESQFVYLPKAKTSAENENGEKTFTNAKGQVITDTIRYEKLLTGELLKENGAKGEYVAKTWLVDKDGNKISETFETPFTPQEENGEVKCKITFDASKFTGGKVVVFEEIYLDGVIVCEHKDLNDEDQSLYQIKIGTTAVNEKTGLHMVKEGEDAVIIDTVSYEGLALGSYILKTYAVNEKGEKIEGTDVETPFENEKSSDTAEVKIPVKAEMLEGAYRFVIFEELYKTDMQQEVLVAEHKDLSDEGQSIYIPKLKTTAKGAKENIIYAAKNQVIKDTISFKGLDPEKSYTIKTCLMDKQTGEAIKGAYKEETFTPDKREGEVTVKIKFDASSFSGKGIVVFEEIDYFDGSGDVPVAEHKDINDKDQSIYVKDAPKILKMGYDHPVILYVIFSTVLAAAAALLIRKVSLS